MVTLTDGRKVEKRVPINRGNPDAPLSDVEVAGKFFRNVDGLLSKSRAKMIVEKIGALESLQDLSDLSRELVM